MNSHDHYVKKPSDSTTTVSEMIAWIDEFSVARNWETYHTPKNLAVSISIEAAELLEHFQWTEGGIWRQGQQSLDREAVAAEMADVLAYLLRLSSILKIDLAGSLASKMEENAKKYPV
ncbi:MAG: nucleotide pyrophosphohydrolase [Pirellula sp.]